MTYNELVAAVNSFVEDSISTTDMNTCIRQAEQKLYNTVQLPSLRKNVTGVLTQDNKYLSAPTDFLSVYSMAVILANGSYTYLIDKDVNFIREAYPTPTATGVPKYYAIFGPRSDDVNELSIILGPTPNSNYSVELHYNYYPESIVTAGATWLGENFDSALFNGTMLEALRYIKSEADVLQMYQEAYVQAVALLKNLGDGKQRTDTYRTGQVRVKPS